jgi:dephospho-CoA kinase
MKDREKLREQFVSHPVSVRLLSLVTHLARVESQAGDSAQSEAVQRVIRESMFFVEYIVPDVELNLQVELVELQRLLARWYHHWAEIQADEARRRAVAEQAGEWSKRIRAAAELWEPAQEVA